MIIIQFWHFTTKLKNIICANMNCTNVFFRKHHFNKNTTDRLYLLVLHVLIINKWNSIRLGSHAHETVTKFVHKTLPGGVVGLMGLGLWGCRELLGVCKRSRRCVGSEGVRIWRSSGYGGLVGVRLRELGVWGSRSSRRCGGLGSVGGSKVVQGVMGESRRCKGPGV